MFIATGNSYHGISCTEKKIFSSRDFDVWDSARDSVPKSRELTLDWNLINDEITENNFLDLFKNLKLKNNLLALEFRITKDKFLKKEFNNHYRRYINSKKFKNKLKRLDLYVKYFIEGQGYAKYNNDDAYVARLIASHNV